MFTSCLHTPLLSLFLLAACISSIYSHDDDNQRRNNLSSSNDTELVRLIVLSFDGFRLEYLSRAKHAGINLPNFDYLIENGAFSETIPSWPTKTFANHFTMATGLEPGEHQVLFSESNCPYDSFTDTNNQSEPKNIDIKPIWVVNNRTGIYFWPCSSQAIGGRVANHYVGNYNHSVSWSTRINALVDWLVGRQLNGTIIPSSAVTLAMSYFEEPDEAAHSLGPDNSKVLDSIVKIDRLLGDLLDLLNRTRVQTEAASLLKLTNILIVTDHIISQTSAQRVLDVAELMNHVLPINVNWTMVSGVPVGDPVTRRLRYPFANVTSTSFSPYAVVAISQRDVSSELLSNLSKAESAYHVHFLTDSSLRQTFHIDAKVFARRFAPSFSLSWTYEDGSPLFPLVILADEQWMLRISANRNGSFASSDAYSGGGVHGYSNQAASMRTFALGFGPAFRKAYKCISSNVQNGSENRNDSCNLPLHAPDIFAVMCTVLNIRCDVLPSSLERVQRILQPRAGADIRELTDGSFTQSHASTTATVTGTISASDVSSNATRTEPTQPSLISTAVQIVLDALHGTVSSASPVTIAMFLVLGGIVLGVALTLSIASCYYCSCRRRRRVRVSSDSFDQSSVVYHRKGKSDQQRSLLSNSDEDEDEDVLLSLSKKSIRKPMANSTSSSNAASNGKKNGKNGATRHYNLERRSLLSASEERDVDELDDDDRFV